MTVLTVKDLPNAKDQRKLAYVRALREEKAVAASKASMDICTVYLLRHEPSSH